jgi:antitoxin (DNA-binding transcriptional repressor) of toxin-antitoxin stability system
MRSVGLKILKNRLSEYVRSGDAGETVLVTDRDRVVAELVPPSPGRGLYLADAFLADAVRGGWLTPPTLPDNGPPPRFPVASFAEVMVEERCPPPSLWDEPLVSSRLLDGTRRLEERDPAHQEPDRLDLAVLPLLRSTLAERDRS